MWSTERRRGTTLIELVVTLAVIALAVGILVPRLGDARGAGLATSARRLGDALAWARDRAILGGRPVRVAFDLERGGWSIGAPGTGPTAVVADASPLARPAVLPASVRLRSVATAGAPATSRGIVALDLDPAGDALPSHLELADARGRVARVVVPPGSGRPIVDVREVSP
jgi:prepilin-type N-terminal cleavage/methylation domain-containing protein